MKIKYLKKYQIVFLVIVQSLMILVILGDINNEKIYLGINKQFILNITIANILLILIFIFILNKFWKLRKKLRYKIFFVLNSLYLINILVNSIRMILAPETIEVNLVLNTIIFIILIGNLVLILTYNRNIREIEKRKNRKFR